MTLKTQTDYALRTLLYLAFVGEKVTVDSIARAYGISKDHLVKVVQQLARLAKTFDIGLSMHSNSHLGVSLMTMAQAAAATPQLTYACDTHYPWQSEEDEVVAGGRIPIVNGCVRIPEKPGLGVELDQDQLARGRERYRKCKYRKRDDEAEMRKHVDPNWRRVLPRW